MSYLRRLEVNCTYDRSTDLILIAYLRCLPRAYAPVTCDLTLISFVDITVAETQCWNLTSFRKNASCIIFSSVRYYYPLYFLSTPLLFSLSKLVERKRLLKRHQNGIIMVYKWCQGGEL